MGHLALVKWLGGQNTCPLRLDDERQRPISTIGMKLETPSPFGRGAGWGDSPAASAASSDPSPALRTTSPTGRGKNKNRHEASLLRAQCRERREAPPLRAHGECLAAGSA